MFELLTYSQSKLKERMDISQTQQIIDNTTAKVSGIAAIPLPFLDVAGMTYLQYKMVEKLAERHGVEIKDSSNIIISSVLSSIVARLISVGLEKIAVKTKLDKMLQDSLIRASISGFLTTIIGEVYDMHFRNGGSLENINLKSFTDYFSKQFASDRWSLSALTDDFMNTIEQTVAA